MKDRVPLSRCIMYQSTGYQIMRCHSNPRERYYVIEQPNGEPCKRNCSYIHRRYKVVCKKIYSKVSGDTWRVERDGMVRNVQVKRGDIISYDRQGHPFIVVEANSPCWTGICSPSGKKEIFFIRANVIIPHWKWRFFRNMM